MTNLKKEIEVSVETLIKEEIAFESDYDKGALLEDLGVDSLARVEIIMKLEKEFSISIADDIFERIKTPQDLIDCLIQAAGVDKLF